MNLQISKKQLGIIVLAILIIGALSAGAYLLLLQPVYEKLERKHTELEMANQELTIIENSLKQSKEKTVLSSMELQKQVPVKRLLDQLLLNIEKAEIISDTTISELKLNGTMKDEEIDFQSNENQNDRTSEESNNSGDADASSKHEEKLPTGIKKISITLNGEAETYFDMEKFIGSLEELTRIVKIEALKFNGLNEIHSIEQNAEVVKFELTLAAYYFPKLEDLRDELPPLDTPGISNKKNPFSSFSEVK
ncbi:pilus assembly protein PilO [Bacillus sp. FJAT-29790]|uniref:pilus assembly protein PilO n=1 Tax=Bacillus sp. FJAT-29790 TaxID=1895002 RepID=UPI001C21DF29|nr:pilus assembly protein PilO [Bacillus sp. FJAT-29790]MBU8879562.1 pilus assembly protein PilO [Bacillus sp. FJAT-29790]